MNENTVNSIEEENTTEATTENTNTNTDILEEEGQSTTDTSLSDDSIALAYDYYESYYNDVLNKLDTLITNEETINTNLENIKVQNDTLIVSCNTIVFVLLLSFVYTFLRNMIIVK